MTDPEKPTTGVVDPDTGEAHPNSGPAGGPKDSDAGTQARDVARGATDGTDADDAQESSGT